MYWGLASMTPSPTISFSIMLCVLYISEAAAIGPAPPAYCITELEVVGTSTSKELTDPLTLLDMTCDAWVFWLS